MKQMRIAIENEILKAEVETFGAELQSIVKKETNQEYMWEADSAFWGKSSPILFPFIGKLEDFTYRYHGREYPQEKHGFARDMDFKVKVQEKDRLVLAIENTAETLAKFPFSFELEVEYCVKGNRLSEQWRVHNRSDETMYFSMGGHPAFACPLIKDGVRSGKRTICSVKLYGVDGREALDSTEIDIKAGLTTGKTFPVAVKDGVFPIVDHIFDGDALVFGKQGVTAAGLLDENGTEYVRLEAPTCPVWGIWSMPTNDASYVCFEPWWGICGEKGEKAVLNEHPYTNHAEAGKVWQEGFEIVIVS